MTGLAWLIVLIGLDGPPDAPAVELARHQGTWQVVSFVREGVESPKALVDAIVREVEGDHVVWKRDGKAFAGTRVELDVSKTPHAIDVIPDGGQNRGERVLGVYSLEGDVLVVCMADPGGDRPTSFEAAKGSKRTLMRFKRGPKRRPAASAPPTASPRR
jgi:uncharacterized protein (TIGR03067 family)